ncbi:hypothetical protein V502_02324 [Pseudogymnoascus sp. VKM F-4520 (FW-2644)]|nr:hypothetical protein V502_02324 [Pseudogymnoascus sp. VKM F-4520 (FW-2644)]
METARATIQLLHKLENLKRLPRAGWVIKGVPNGESVADHSLRLAAMAFFAPVYKKHEQEKRFFQYAKSILPDHPVPEYWMELWQEYEDRKSKEALWLYDADKAESVIQSVEYANRGHKNLSEFLGLIPKFTTPQMANWGKVLREEVHRPIIFVTGLPNVDKTTHSKLLSEKFDALYLSLSGILQEQSDPKNSDAAFAALCLQEGLDISPTGYLTDILKENIDEGIKQGKRCVVIEGFPRNVKQLRGFEEKVQGGNLILLLTSIRQGSAPDSAIRALQELENEQEERLFKKIDCDGSEEEVGVPLMHAVEAFILQASN